MSLLTSAPLPLCGFPRVQKECVDAFSEGCPYSFKAARDPNVCSHLKLKVHTVWLNS